MHDNCRRDFYSRGVRFISGKQKRDGLKPPHRGWSWKLRLLPFHLPTMAQYIIFQHLRPLTIHCCFLGELLWAILWFYVFQYCLLHPKSLDLTALFSFTYQTLHLLFADHSMVPGKGWLLLSHHISIPYFS